MNIEEILSQLKSEDSTFPRKALQEAISQREEIIPHLLKILEDTNNNFSEILDRPNDLSLLYAMFLLAQFRETSAYPLIVKLVSNNEDVVEDLLGDVVTESLPRILASVCGTELDLIKGLIENPEIYEYVRSSSVKSLIILVAQGLLSRDEVINYFQELLQNKKEQNDYYYWSILVRESTYLCPKEIEVEVKELFKKDLIDPFMIRLKNFESSLKVSAERSLAKVRKNQYYSLVDNTITEMESWPYFKQEPSKKLISTKEVAPSFSALVNQVNPSGKKMKKSKKKKKRFK